MMSSALSFVLGSNRSMLACCAFCSMLPKNFFSAIDVFSLSNSSWELVLQPHLVVTNVQFGAWHDSTLAILCD